MPSEQVAIALDLCGALLDAAACAVTPGEGDHPPLGVHGLVGSNAKGRQAPAGVAVTMVDLACPPSAVTLPGLGGRARERRPQQGRRGLPPGGPCGHHDTALVGHSAETPCSLTHARGRAGPSRRGAAPARLAPGPARGSPRGEAPPLARAMALAAAGPLPFVATDRVAPWCRGVPTVARDIPRPAWGPERTAGCQNRARQGGCAAASPARRGSAVARAAAHRLGPQVQTPRDGAPQRAQAQRTHQRTPAVLVAGCACAPVVMVVMHIARLQLARGLVWLAQRVGELDVPDRGRPAWLGRRHPPGGVLGSAGRTPLVGLPGAEAPTVGPLRRRGGVDTLARQSGERLVVRADQQSLGHGEDGLTWRPGELKRSRVENRP